jgi:hypothetical protein
VWAEQPTPTTAHNTYQNCVSVVPAEGGQVMPATCRSYKTRIKVKVKVKVKYYQVGCVYYVFVYTVILREGKHSEA